MSTVSEATRILAAVSGGDRSSVDRLMELVHEAFIKLIATENPDWRSRSHFYAVAATAMRQILVDAARQWLSHKRGGGQIHVELPSELPLSISRDADVLALDEALVALEAVRPTPGSTRRASVLRRDDHG